MKYIGYYDVEQYKDEDRYYPPAGKAKMEYIAGVLAQINDLEIVSASGVKGRKSAKASCRRLSNNIALRKFYSVGRKNKLLSFVSTRYLRIQLFIFLLFNAKKDEPLIVYHSLGYCNLIRWVKKLKKPRLILEMEEVYADVSGKEVEREKELRLSACADAFIFPTKLLDDAINTKQKPAVIVHGTYKVEPDRHGNVFNDDVDNSKKKTIHVVYAGTLDPRKGGAIAAAAAEHLPSNYYIHILGFGGDKDIQEMKKLVADVQSRSKATVSYDGLLSGEEYIRFIQSCDIGLSTQNPDAAFNETSFPSKILSYLANGLHVVSIRIPAIEESAIGDLLSYYDHQTPEEIAKAIVDVDFTETYDSRARIKLLDHKFEDEITKLIDAI